MFIAARPARHAGTNQGRIGKSILSKIPPSLISVEALAL